MTTVMQPFQCDLQPEIPKHPITTHTQADPKQLQATITLQQEKKANRPQPQPPHRRGTFHRRLQPLYTEKHKVSCSGFLPKTEPLQHHAAIPMRSEGTDSKTPYNYARTSTPKAAGSHHYTAARKRRQTDRSRNRRTDEVPFIAGCSHFTRKNTRFRAPASSPKQSPCNIMQPFQCNLKAQIPKHPITMHAQAHPKQLEATVTMRQEKKANRPQRQPPHRRGTFHRRLQPLYTEKPKVSCSGFLPNSPLAFVTASLPHHFPSSPPHFVTTSLPHHFPSSPHPIVHFPSSPLPFLTTSHRPHLPSSPLAFIITSLRHHFPSSPLPIVTTSLPHHFPSSPPPIVPTCLPHSLSSSLPSVTTSLRHHFPSSPLPSVTTSLPHHFPSSPLPFLTTSRHHHFPSSPLPFFTTSLPHHFPSSPLPFVTTSLRHHFPSSALPFFTTSLRHHFPSSPLPFLTTSLRHHSPSSSLPFFTHPVS